jgi:cobalt-zinc-cadmium efflux system membrane fusion protein
VKLPTLPCLVSLAVLLAACHDAPPPAAAEAPAPQVQGRQVRFAPRHPQLAFLGTAVAEPSKAIGVDMPARLVWNEEHTQRLYPAFAGRVLAIHADVGQVVKAGSVLAELASPDFGAAQADAAKAQVDVRLTQQALQRQRELFEVGIAARKELEQAEADAARARAEAARAHARTGLYGSPMDGAVNQRLALRAALGGVVVERNLNPGQELRPDTFGPGAPASFVVSDPASLWVLIDARESEAATLQPGALFELSVPTLPERRFAGRVTATAGFVDPATRTIKVRGVVDNPDRLLKAEMLATARIERRLGSGIVIPAQAVTLNGTTHSVFVQLEPGVFESRDVTLGYQGPQQVVVSRGIQAGERVVTDNVLLLARQLKLAADEAPQRAAAEHAKTAP